MMFDMRCSRADGQGEEARGLAREATEIFGEFNISDVIWFFKFADFQGFRKRFMDIHRRYDSLLEKIITDGEQVRKEKNKNGRRTTEVGEDEEARDFLDFMLDVLENENSEMKLTRDHIKVLVLDFLTAGADTTDMAVEWALAEIINNPIVVEKPQKEIDQVVGITRLVQESDCPNLPYIQAIVKETLMLDPPLPRITRKSTEDCKIGEYLIPKGTLLFVNIWSTGRDPNVWKNPLKPQPEMVQELILMLGDCNINYCHLELEEEVALEIIEPCKECLPLWQKVVHLEGGEINGGDNVVDMSERPGLTTPRAHDLVCAPVAQCTL